MSNIYNKKWKNKLSVPILLPLIVGSDTMAHQRSRRICSEQGFVGF